MRETSKAMRRRWCEAVKRIFPWKSVFIGNGLDVGSGDDPLPVKGCVPFDQEHGDANTLSVYFPAGTFDYVHSSQCLEHMRDPIHALEDWMKVVKPGGHLVGTVPDWTLYEGEQWPSHYNPDHKASFSIGRGGLKTPAPTHIDFPLIFPEHPWEVRLCRIVDTNYDYGIGTTIDQTFDESAGVEAFIEFVLRKPL